MILIPQYRTARRASAVASVSVLQTAQALVNTGGSITFGSAINAGEMIVIVHGRPSTGSVTLTKPTGFTDTYNPGAVLTPLAVFTKIAGGSESGSYVVTSAATNNCVAGYVLSACSVGDQSSEYQSATGTTLTIGSAGIGVSAGSIVIAARACGTSSAKSTTSNSFDNSFTADYEIDSAAFIAASRAYGSAASSQQTTNSWTTSRVQRRGIIVEFVP